MEYFARDPAPALAFYTALLGYRSEVREQVAGLSYHVLLDARPRAGLLPVPQAGMRPAWLPYVMVADPAGLATQAESLGGAVLFAPRSDVRKGTLASWESAVVDQLALPAYRRARSAATLSICNA